MRIPSHLTLYEVYARSPRLVRAVVDAGYRFVPERFLRSPRMRRTLAEIERTQWLSSAELAHLQTGRLRALLEHAGAHVPYYRELFARVGFDSSRLQSAGDLTVLPVLTRFDVQRLGPALHSEAFAARDVYESATSGSTGIWLTFRRDAGYYDTELAFTWRYLRWLGVRVASRHAIFYRAIMRHPSPDASQPPHERYRNRLILSQFHTDDQSFAAYVRMLDDFRAEYMTVFPTTLLMLTRYCATHAPRVHRPRLIVCYSENLYDEHRREMEAFWGCRIYNRYGHSEGCVSAAECEAGRLHLSAEYGVTELLRDDGTPCEPGEEGRIVATGLYTTSMPFVRYDTGDRGVLDAASCPCGRGLPVLARVDGRGDDLIVGSDGRRVAAYRAVYAHTRGIRFTQIVQERAGEITVRIVPDEDYDESVQDVLRANIVAQVGQTLAVRFEIVDDVERTPSGKIRLVLSRLREG
jgi:phenylacetate-CoA ligase